MGRGKGEGGKQEAGTGDDIDGLFQLPLTEFTPARNALVTRLKKSGDAERADEVRSLSKPPASAWAVNQLFWRHRAAFDRLIAAGEQFRTAQSSQLAGRSADLRGPLEARRSVLADLSKLAAATLRDGGHSPTPDTMRRVTTTLEALSAYGAAGNGPRPGRLQDDVDPPGFETLAALVPGVGREPGASEQSRVIPFQRQSKREKKDKSRPPEEERKLRLAAAKAAVQDAEKALRDAQKTAHRAEEALKKAAARSKEAEKIRADAEQKFEKAAAAADAARKEARSVAAEAEDAAQALQDAERALETATRALTDLSS